MIRKAMKVFFVNMKVSFINMKVSFINDLLSANYYSLFTNESTDASMLEQEVIYVLYLSKQGEPVVKFFHKKKQRNMQMRMDSNSA